MVRSKEKVKHTKNQGVATRRSGLVWALLAGWAGQKGKDKIATEKKIIKVVAGRSGIACSGERLDFAHQPPDEAVFQEKLKVKMQNVKLKCKIQRLF